MPFVTTALFFLSLTLLSATTDPPSPGYPLLMYNASDAIKYVDCPRPPFAVENGQAVVTGYFLDHFVITVTCNENSTLIGKNVVLGLCFNGKWEYPFCKSGRGRDLPRCRLRCPPPPYLEKGKLSIAKVREDTELGYSEGTVVTYTCHEGYSPQKSVRECRNGIWSGANVFCKAVSDITCPVLPNILYGFVEPQDDYNHFGAEVIYECLPGYKMVGSAMLRCTIDGTWSDGVPLCILETDFYTSRKCTEEPVLEAKMRTKMTVTSVTADVAVVDCRAPYRNELAPCTPAKFYCKNGQWEGVYPNCVKAYTCAEPPAVHYSQAMNRNFETSYDSKGRPYYPINAQISYECLKGYTLEGGSIVSCQPNGCWQSGSVWPKCVRTVRDDYFAELNNINAIFVSTATGAAVLGVLLLACLVVACKKRRALVRAAPLPPPGAGAHHSNDHTTFLLQNPDRLALIAFADGENSLPSYDEATRDRSTLIQVSRVQIQRPHWPGLTACRTNRNNDHHVTTRHGSIASHTPSMRSRAESSGSTDTVAISEGSTNITLDTASSHSAASQNASCRGHCGSIASFDACSIVNSEGIPLLEENEIEGGDGPGADSQT